MTRFDSGLMIACLVGACGACSGGKGAVSSGGHDPLAPFAAVDTPDAPELTDPECGMAFDPVPELLGATERATARWSAATGCDVRVESGGIPVVAQGFVFLGGGDFPIYGSDPQLERHQVCGATVRRGTGEVVGIWVSTQDARCDVAETVAHELGHTMGPNGTHADDGIGAETNSPRRTAVITPGTLVWACSEFACGEMRPE